MALNSLNIKSTKHYVTSNFTIEEFLQSQTATLRKIKNLPNDCNAFCDVSFGLIKLALLCQRVRDHHSRPIAVTSGYRCRELNTAVKGVQNSLHITGHACDIKSADMKGLLNSLKYVQSKTHIEGYGNLFRIVMEPTWYHVQLEDVGKRISMADFITLIQP